MIFVNLKNVENPTFRFFEKDGRRKIMKIHPIISWKSWTWDQHLPEDLKWKFGDMGSLSL